MIMVNSIKKILMQMFTVLEAEALNNIWKLEIISTVLFKKFVFWQMELVCFFFDDTS